MSNRPTARLAVAALTGGLTLSAVAFAPTEAAPTEAAPAEAAPVVCPTAYQLPGDPEDAKVDEAGKFDEATATAPYEVVVRRWER